MVPIYPSLRQPTSLRMFRFTRILPTIPNDRVCLKSSFRDKVKTPIEAAKLFLALKGGYLVIGKR